LKAASNSLSSTILVEERVGERRLVLSGRGRRFDYGVPLSLSLSPRCGARGRDTKISQEFARK
jgi:hypothetical protein